MPASSRVRFQRGLLSEKGRHYPLIDLLRSNPAVRRPEAKKMNVAELIDNCFVKELEDSGFVKSLYGGR